MSEKITTIEADKKVREKISKLANKSGMKVRNLNNLLLRLGMEKFLQEFSGLIA